MIPGTLNVTAAWLKSSKPSRMEATVPDGSPARDTINHESSKGRTTGFGPVNLGSSPSS